MADPNVDGANTRDTIKKACFSEGSSPKLTPAEAEVLYLLTQEFLTPRQIEYRRNCSQQAVSQIIVSLKKKGYLKKSYNSLVKSQGTPQVGNKIRLHGMEFNVNILFKDERYKQVLARGNIIHVDGNTVRLYNDSIEIYGTNSFFGEDENDATAKAMDYYTKFIQSLENQLKVILLKPRSQNVRIVKQEYAEIGNEYAKECNKTGQRLKVHATEDGKLWAEIDNSFNLHEFETKKPETAKQDMEKVRIHFNDIRDHSPPTLSQLMVVLKEMAEINKETAAGLNAVAQILKPKIPEDTPHNLRERPDYVG